MTIIRMFHTIDLRDSWQFLLYLCLSSVSCPTKIDYQYHQFKRLQYWKTRCRIYSCFNWMCVTPFGVPRFLLYWKTSRTRYVRMAQSYRLLHFHFTYLPFITVQMFQSQCNFSTLMSNKWYHTSIRALTLAGRLILPSVNPSCFVTSILAGREDNSEGKVLQRFGTSFKNPLRLSRVYSSRLIHCSMQERLTENVV